MVSWNAMSAKYQIRGTFRTSNHEVACQGSLRDGHWPLGDLVTSIKTYSMCQQIQADPSRIREC